MSHHGEMQLIILRAKLDPPASCAGLIDPPSIRIAYISEY